MTKTHAFKIVAACEDFGAIMQARELSSRLAAELRPECEMNSDAWKFEALGCRQSGKEAAKGAAKADMVIIAASGDAEPPSDVKLWIESWLPRRRKGGTTLVALLHGGVKSFSKSSPLCKYLRRIAGKWNMDFFSNAPGWWQQHFKSSAPSESPGVKWAARQHHPAPDGGLRGHMEMVHVAEEPVSEAISG